MISVDEIEMFHPDEAEREKHQIDICVALQLSTWQNEIVT
jgi:hypothetical protein